MANLLLLALASALLAGCADGDATETPTEGGCDQGSWPCGGACVDLSTDAAHCGACGVACADGQRCLEGACAAACDEGKSPCQGSCVDLSRDPRNCGQCGESCAEGLVCANGRCAAFCEEGEALCDGSCVDTRVSPAHCGGCDIACSAGETCDAGTCRRSCELEEGGCPPTCGEGLDACGMICVDTASAPDHCGACDQACGEGWLCEEGRCRCPDGSQVCDGRCVDTARDPAHCGQCGQACGPQQLCLDGGCACPAGTEACESGCFDLEDDQNCGACGNDCGVYVGLPHVEDATCAESACTLSCAAGYGNCSGALESGCETHLSSDPGNCGACGHDCASLGNVEEVLGCEEGVCAFTCMEHWGDCDFLAENGCETDLRSSAKACGSCYNNCHLRPGVEIGTCVDAACGIERCQAGFADCDEEPSNGCEVDLLNTREQCGACGHACPIACVGGVCVGFVGLGTGDEHSCVLAGDGKAWCWGRNHQGQLGSGFPAPASRPQALPAPGDIAQITGGSAHTCALTKAGRIWCWGQGANGRLGQGDSTSHPEAQLVPNLTGVVQIDAGSAHTCAVDLHGNLFCWGKNDKGQIGVGASSADVTSPLQVAVGKPVADVAAGHTHTCARTTTGEVFCWGSNSDGQIGDGSLGGERRSPTQVQGLADVEAIAAGWYHSCARGNGQVWCWGANINGALGIGSTDWERTTPTLVSALSEVVEIALGEDNGCALTAQGKVWCWGANQEGQLGDASTTTRLAPVELELNEVRGISYTKSHGCAWTQDDDIYCWGVNAHGQLGAGHANPTLTPVQVSW